MSNSFLLLAIALLFYVPASCWRVSNGEVQVDVLLHQKRPVTHKHAKLSLKQAHKSLNNPHLITVENLPDIQSKWMFDSVTPAPDPNTYILTGGALCSSSKCTQASRVPQILDLSNNTESKPLINSSYLLPPMYGHSSIVLRNEIWIFPGLIDASESSYTKILRVDLTTGFQVWHDIPFSGRFGMTVVHHPSKENHLIIAGGLPLDTENSFKYELLEFDTTTNNVNTYDSRQPSNVLYPRVYITDSVVSIMGEYTIDSVDRENSVISTTEELVDIQTSLQSSISVIKRKLLDDPHSHANCSTATNCWSCTNIDKSCVWCLSEGKCTTRSDCVWTPYTDCCVTINSCKDCTERDGCGYCSTDNFVGCLAGNSQGTNATWIKCSSWLFHEDLESGDICPKGPDDNFSESFLIGVVLSVGLFFVVLSITLLVAFIYYSFKKQNARDMLIKRKRELHETTYSPHSDENGDTQGVTGANVQVTQKGGYTTLAPLIRRGRKSTIIK